MEDNCRRHRAINVGEHMALQGLQRLDWALEAPHMSPNGNALSVLEARRRAQVRMLATLTGLFMALCEERDCLPDNVFHSL